LNKLNTSNIPEDIYNLDAELDSSSPDQLLSSKVTVTNSLSCIMHTIQLALGDRFDDTKVSNLISKAKTLNSYVSDKDKYHESLCELQAKLNSQHQVNPLSSDTRTH
ncbi:1113_t:CDS:2, partial [Dentiscutata heterogama]